MTTAVCSHCGNPLRPGAKFCPTCGAVQLQPPGQRCSRCMAVLRPGAKFCSACGQSVAAPGLETTSELYCPNCKTKIRGGSKFCPRCGRQVVMQPAVNAQPISAMFFRRHLWIIIAAIGVIILLTIIGTRVTFRDGDLDMPETATPHVAATLTMQAATPTLRIP